MLCEAEYVKFHCCLCFEGEFIFLLVFEASEDLDVIKSACMSLMLGAKYFSPDVTIREIILLVVCARRSSPDVTIRITTCLQSISLLDVTI